MSDTAVEAAPARRSAIVLKLPAVAGIGEAIGVSLIYAVAVIAVFHQLALSNGVPFGYDLYNYFYPHLAYAGDRLRAGELPAWNPYLFLGVPFLANIQTAVFYPATWLSLWLDPPDVVRYAALFHHWLAAVGTYALLRVQFRVVPVAALLGGLCFGLGGFVSSQFGHPNQLAAAAWLPIVLLAAGRVICSRTPAWSAVLALVIALQFLAGHTQEFYFSMVLLSCFSAALLLERLLAGAFEGWRPKLGTLRANVAEVIRAGAFLGLAGIIAGLLMAPQLLPTLELQRLSIRGGGLSFEEASSFSWPPIYIVRGLLPPFGESPYGEYIGYIGIIGLVFALYGVVQARRPWYAAFFAVVTLVALVLAIGGFNPLYGKLLSIIPGLGLFRVPARWLFIAGFSLSMLAALGLDGAVALADRSRRGMLRRGAAFIVLAILVIGVVALIWPLQSLPSEGVIRLWLLFTAIALVLVLVAITGRLRAAAAAATVGVVLIELFLAGVDLDGRRVTAPEAYSSWRPVPLQLSLDPSLFRALTISLAEYQPGDANDLKSLLGDITSPERIDDLLIAHKYKDLLIPNQGLRYGIPTLDGYDGGVLPLRRFVEFKQSVLESGGLRLKDGAPVDPTQPDGLLREQLGGVPSPELLGLLNVKYVILDRTRDVWHEGAYIDVAIGSPIQPGASLRVDMPDVAGTELLLVFHRPAPAAEGEPPARVLLRTWSHKWEESLITLGAPGPETEVLFEDLPSHPHLVLARVRFPEPRRLAAFEVLAPADSTVLTLAGATMFDRTSGSNEPISIDRRFELVHLGDLKVYRNRSALERAMIAYNYTISPNLTDTIRTLRSGVAERVVLDQDPGFPNPMEIYPIQSARIESYQPERIRIAAEAERDGLLVVSDAWYPGWRAYVDGREQPILLVNHALRGVKLTPGAHVVELVYEPAPLEVGLQLAVGGLAAVMTIFVGSLLLACYPVRR